MISRCEPSTSVYISFRGGLRCGTGDICVAQPVTGAQPILASPREIPSVFQQSRRLSTSRSCRRVTFAVSRHGLAPRWSLSASAIPFGGIGWLNRRRFLNPRKGLLKALESGAQRRNGVGQPLAFGLAGRQRFLELANLVGHFLPGCVQVLLDGQLGCGGLNDGGRHVRVGGFPWNGCENAQHRHQNDSE
jgi:hypothetical protein